jgi:hypothetical protein
LYRKIADQVEIFQSTHIIPDRFELAPLSRYSGFLAGILFRQERANFSPSILIVLIFTFYRFAPAFSIKFNCLPAHCHSFEIFTGSGVDFDDIPFFYEKWHLNFCAGLNRTKLLDIGGRVSFHTWLGFNNLKLNEIW